jgi:hypothetical protein
MLLAFHRLTVSAGCYNQGSQGRGGRGEEEVRALSRKGFSLFRLHKFSLAVCSVAAAAAAAAAAATSDPKIVKLYRQL